MGRGRTRYFYAGPLGHAYPKTAKLSWGCPASAWLSTRRSGWGAALGSYPFPLSVIRHCGAAAYTTSSSHYKFRIAAGPNKPNVKGDEEI